MATADQASSLFLHQAVLSAVICARTRIAEQRWIPISHAYPLGLHARVPDAKQAARLNDVVSLIYDQVWEQDPEWMSQVVVDEPLTWKAPRVTCSMRRATPRPCNGLRSRTFRTSRSSVPRRRSFSVRTPGRNT